MVYCSATGATSLAHMAYMERLGLWGEETPFPKFGDFQKAMGNGQNVGAMELVALDMKRRVWVRARVRVRVRVSARHEAARHA